MNKTQNADEIIRDFCRQFDFKLPKNPTKTYGIGYGFDNPGAKDMYDIVEKCWRKLAEENHYKNYVNKHTNYTFNRIRDLARCSVVVPDFRDLPELLEIFAKEFGGEIIIHNRPDYIGVHLQSQITLPDDDKDQTTPTTADTATTDAEKDDQRRITMEIQFQTNDTRNAKKATDPHYKKFRYRMARNPEKTKQDPEYIKEQEYMAIMLSTIYERSGFQEALPQFTALATKYNQPVPPMPYENFLIMARDAQIAQKILCNRVEGIVAEHATQKLKQELIDIFKTHDNSERMTQAEIDHLLNDVHPINVVTPQPTNEREQH